MRLPPPNEDSVRDYLEWSYRRADSLLTAWKFRKQARLVKYEGNIDSFRGQARVYYSLAMNFKKELGSAYAAIRRARMEMAKEYIAG